MFLANGFPPVPDLDVTIGPTALFWLTLCGALLTTACVVGGVVEIVWKRSALLLLCTIGAVFTPLIEPIWDVIGHLHFSSGAVVAFTAFPQLNFPIEYPVWSILAYVPFAGPTCWAFYLILRSRPSRRIFWGAVVGGQLVMNTVTEWVLIHTHGYQYYGDNQPLRVWGFPLWWLATNFGELLGAVVMLLLINRYGKRAAALAVIVVPASFGAWEMWAGWPVYVALNNDVGTVVTTIAALVAFAIALATIWFIERVIVIEGVGSAKAPTESAQASPHSDVGDRPGLAPAAP